jgi:hypothetical protein
MVLRKKNPTNAIMMNIGYSQKAIGTNPAGIYILVMDENEMKTRNPITPT